MISEDKNSLCIEQILEFRKKYNKQFLFYLFKHYPWLEQHLQEFATEIKELKISNQSQILYHYINKLKDYPSCPVCKNRITTFGVNRKWQYNTYCCRQCISKDQKVIQSRKKEREYSTRDRIAELAKEATQSFDNNVKPQDIISFMQNKLDTKGLKVLFLHRHKDWYGYLVNRFQTKKVEEALYMLMHNLDSKPICSDCKKQLHFKAYEKGYEKCKTNSCLQKRKTQQLQTKDTSLDFTHLSLNNIQEQLRVWVKTAPLNSIKQTLRKQHYNLYKNVLLHHKSLRPNKKFSETVYCITHNIHKTPVCQYCNKHSTKFQTILKGYTKFCGASCAAKSTIENKLIKTTASLRAKNYDLWVKKFDGKDESINTKKEDFIKTGKLELECTICGYAYERFKAFDIRCPKCRKISISKPELEICNFLETEHNINIIKNSKKIIPPLEIDIFVPEKKIAIEFNGLYWHSDERIAKNYHLNKTLMCEKRGIQLIHIFENEWNNNKDLVKSLIASKLNLNKNTIHARKCHIKEIDNKSKNSFLFKNHIQGSDNSKYKLGLFFGDELVSVMTFGKRKITGSAPVMELMRYCSKQNTRVIGGASKLFSYFLKQHTPNKVITYANRRYSNGNLYSKLGFVLKHTSPPNYWYFNAEDCRTGKIHHRSRFQKHRLQKMLPETFNPSTTEWENMKNAGYLRIWDCGNYVYEWKETTLNQKNLTL